VRRHNAFVSARYDAVISALGEVPGHLILDIGGGDGALSFLLARRGARAVIADKAREALRFAQEEYGHRGLEAHTVEVLAYSLPLPTGRFDAAICCDVIEHVQSPDRLLAEASRILRPGGRFVLTTPLRITEKPLDRMHVHEFFADELESLMISAFKDVAVRMFAPLALLDLFHLPFRWLGGRPLFRYLFNAATIYWKLNPFSTRLPFRHSSMLIATGRRE
jgi:ubiquinone/menaquinone biosynthesis C-methylase UbiE